MDADFKGELYGAYIYIEKVEFPYQNLPALKKIKVPSFLTKPLFSAKQPNRAKCHEMKSGGKIGKRRVLGNEFFLQFWYLENMLIMDINSSLNFLHDFEL